MNTTPIPSFEEETTPPCEVCGCTGNQSCGHEPLDKEVGCALPDGLICGCCWINENHMNDMIKPDAKQTDLFK